MQDFHNIEWDKNVYKVNLEEGQVYYFDLFLKYTNRIEALNQL